MNWSDESAEKKEEKNKVNNRLKRVKIELFPPHRERECKKSSEILLLPENRDRNETLMSTEWKEQADERGNLNTENVCVKSEKGDVKSVLALKNYSYTFC